MKKLFCMLVSTFTVLLIINISWIIINLFYWASVGIQDVIVAEVTTVLLLCRCEGGAFRIPLAIIATHDPVSQTAG